MIREVQCGDHALKFAIFNDACNWRVDTFHTKEPHTLRWLDELTGNDVLWDIGANIGLYTVYAAVTRRCRVVAFEPLVSNLYALTANVGINNIQDLVQILPVALSDRDAVDTLYCSSLEIGSSCHSAGAELSPGLKPKNTKGRQNIMLTRSDTILETYGVENPTHMKIDVDGLEHLVIGGFGFLNNRSGPCRSLIVETNWNLDEHRQMVERLQKIDFAHDPAQYAAAQRKDGPFVGTGEMILRRT